MEHPRVVRLSMAAGLFVEFVGFVYDTLWHDQHLSEVAIQPSELLTVHSGIYLGELIVLGIAIATLARRGRKAAPPALLWTVVVGGVVQLIGSGLDMWSHAHGYEKDLYHNTIYTGAAITVVGYLLMEAFAAKAARRDALFLAEDVSADEAKQTVEH